MYISNKSIKVSLYIPFGALKKRNVQKEQCNMSVRWSNGITMAQGATNVIQKLPPRNSLVASGYTNPLTLPIILNQRVVREKAQQRLCLKASRLYENNIDVKLAGYTGAVSLSPPTEQKRWRMAAEKRTALRENGTHLQWRRWVSGGGDRPPDGSASVSSHARQRGNGVTVWCVSKYAFILFS